MFYKESCFKKFRKPQWKTPVSKRCLNKVAGPEPASFLEKRLQNKCFPVKFAKFLRTPILKNICKRVLLEVYIKAVLKNFAIITGRK